MGVSKSSSINHNSLQSNLQQHLQKQYKLIRKYNCPCYKQLTVIQNKSTKALYALKQFILQSPPIQKIQKSLQKRQNSFKHPNLISLKDYWIENQSYSFCSNLKKVNLLYQYFQKSLEDQLLQQISFKEKNQIQNSRQNTSYSCSEDNSFYFNQSNLQNEINFQDKNQKINQNFKYKRNFKSKPFTDQQLTDIIWQFIDCLNYLQQKGVNYLLGGLKNIKISKLITNQNNIKRVIKILQNQQSVIYSLDSNQQGIGHLQLQLMNYHYSSLPLHQKNQRNNSKNPQKQHHHKHTLSRSLSLSMSISHSKAQSQLQNQANNQNKYNQQMSEKISKFSKYFEKDLKSILLNKRELPFHPAVYQKQQYNQQRNLNQRSMFAFSKQGLVIQNIFTIGILVLSFANLKTPSEMNLYYRDNYHFDRINEIKENIRDIFPKTYFHLNQMLKRKFSRNIKYQNFLGNYCLSMTSIKEVNSTEVDFCKQNIKQSCFKKGIEDKIIMNPVINMKKSNSNNSSCNKNNNLCIKDFNFKQMIMMNQRTNEQKSKNNNRKVYKRKS